VPRRNPASLAAPAALAALLALGGAAPAARAQGFDFDESLRRQRSLCRYCGAAPGASHSPGLPCNPSSSGASGARSDSSLGAVGGLPSSYVTGQEIGRAVGTAVGQAIGQALFEELSGANAARAAEIRMFEAAAAAARAEELRRERLARAGHMKRAWEASDRALSDSLSGVFDVTGGSSSAEAVDAAEGGGADAVDLADAVHALPLTPFSRAPEPLPPELLDGSVVDLRGPTSGAPPSPLLGHELRWAGLDLESQRRRSLSTEGAAPWRADAIAPPAPERAAKARAAALISGALAWRDDIADEALSRLRDRDAEIVALGGARSRILGAADVGFRLYKVQRDVFASLDPERLAGAGRDGGAEALALGRSLEKVRVDALGHVSDDAALPTEVTKTLLYGE